MSIMPKEYSDVMPFAAMFFNQHAETAEVTETFEKFFKASVEAVQTVRSYLSNPDSVANGKPRVNIDGSLISYSEIFYKTLFHSLDAEVFRNQLVPYRRALSTLVMDVFSEYSVLSNGRILEVGSGGFPLAEVLGNVSEQKKDEITLSDVRVQVVARLRLKYPDFSSEYRDLLRLSQVEGKNSLGAVVMTSVLDTLDPTQLRKGFQEVFKCLKPGGVMVHFTPRCSFPSATNSDYYDPGKVFFPVIDRTGGWVGIKVAEMSELKRAVSSFHPILDKALIDALNTYIAMTPAAREEYCTEMVNDKKAHILNLFLAALTKKQCAWVEEVSYWDAFKKRLIDNATAVNAVVLYQGNMSRSFIGNRCEALHHKKGKHQQFSLIDGVNTESFSGVLRPCFIQEVIRCHVFVIRRPLP